MEDCPSSIESFVGKSVVIDTTSPIVYIGKLTSVSDDTLKLEEVDVHDMRETGTGKDLYLINAKKHGVKMNRKEVTVLRHTVACVSLLEDIIEY